MKKKINQIIAKYSPIPVKAIKENSDLVLDLYLGGFDFSMIKSDIEIEFNIKLNITFLKTKYVKDIYNSVDRFNLKNINLN